MKIVFKSIGCRTNQEECSELTAALSGKGHQIVSDLDEADVVMVNSCSVTAATESKTRRLIASIAHTAPQARIMVTGCFAQQSPHSLSTMKNVHWVVGNRQKGDIVSILDSGDAGIFHSGFGSRDEPIHLALPDRVIAAPQNEGGRTRFPVKIQEGCDFACSYCIVPSLRGPSRSARTGAVLDTCKRAIDAGYKEIVITGTHIGQFWSEADKGLEALVEEIISLDGDFRVRLSSLDPRDCTSRLLALVGSEKKVCDHLHISLQSGSPDVLKGMGRPVDEALRVIDELIRFRSAYPTSGIGADIIVGFPGETGRQFEETCLVLEKCAPSYMHVFKFSGRPGTRAAGMSDQVSEPVRNERSLRVRTLAADLRTRFLNVVSAVPQRIIIESERPLRGLTANYLHVEIDNVKAAHNTWLDILVSDGIRGRYCLAKPVNSKVE